MGDICINNMYSYKLLNVYIHRYFAKFAKINCSFANLILLGCHYLCEPKHLAVIMEYYAQHAPA